MYCIIYPIKSGVAVVYPAPEFIDQVEAVAQKDVPADTVYRIIEVKDLPSQQFRDRWLWTEEGPLGVAEEVIATE